MRIRSVRVDGYKSLQDFSWPHDEQGELGRLVVLYGQNGTGKSNILSFLDLVLNAPARGGLSTGRGWKLRSDAHAFALQLGRDRPITGRLVIEKDIGLVRRAVQDFAAAPDTGNPEVVSALVAHMEALQPDGNLVVSIDVEIREEDREGQLFVAFPSVTVGERVLVVGGGLARGDGSGQHLGKSAILDRVLQLLTSGFVYLPCPRELGLNEQVIHLDRPEGMTNQFKHEALWWRRAFVQRGIPYDSLANVLYWARLDPAAASLVAELDAAVAAYIGPLGIQYARRIGTDQRIRFATPLQHSDKTLGQDYLPTRALGTGAQQLVYILVARYLLEAPIIAIDELEANLAPDLQRELWSLLASDIESNRLDQLMVASHSPVFLLDDTAHQSVDVQYVEHDKDSGTTIARRLDTGNGEVRSELYDHFGVYSRRLWKRLSTVRWPDSAAIQLAIYRDDGQEPVGSDYASFESAVQSGKPIGVVGRSISEVPREQLKRLSHVVALDEWLPEDPSDDSTSQVSIDWSAPSSSIAGTLLNFRAEISRASSKACIVIDLTVSPDRVLEIGLKEAWLAVKGEIESKLDAISGRLGRPDALD